MTQCCQPLHDPTTPATVGDREGQSSRQQPSQQAGTPAAQNPSVTTPRATRVDGSGTPVPPPTAAREVRGRGQGSQPRQSSSIAPSEKRLRALLPAEHRGPTAAEMDFRRILLESRVKHATAHSSMSAFNDAVALLSGAPTTLSAVPSQNAPHRPCEHHTPASHMCWITYQVALFAPCRPLRFSASVRDLSDVARRSMELTPYTGEQRRGVSAPRLSSMWHSHPLALPTRKWNQVQSERTSADDTFTLRVATTSARRAFDR